MDDLIALAWSGETALLSPDVRSDSIRLLELLAPEFTEIGQSGRRWDRSGIIAALTVEAAAVLPTVLSEQEARRIGPDAVLLSYLLQVGERRSLRSSLWRRAGDSAQCVFHQGTPVA